MDHEDIAYGIVQDYLAEGPEHLSIVETVTDYDEGASESDVEVVALLVRRTLKFYATRFNIQ